MGYKTFGSEPLYASDVNDLLMRQSVIKVANQAARDAIPLPDAGLTVYRQDTKAFEMYSGTVWRTFDTEWQTFTPKIYIGAGELGNPNGTIGNGSSTGRYYRSGKSVRIRGGYIVGSTTAYTGLSGGISVGFPSGITAATHTNSGFVGSMDAPQGTYTCLAGTTTVSGYCNAFGGNLDRMYFTVHLTGALAGGSGSAANINQQLAHSYGLNAAGCFVNYDYTITVA